MAAERAAHEGKSMNSATRIGLSFPLGATIIEGGANFSLFSRGATGVELLFFDNESDARPSRVIHIDPAANRTYHYWHVPRCGTRTDLRLPRPGSLRSLEGNAI